jgi:hypothetical protein
MYILLFFLITTFSYGEDNLYNFYINLNNFIILNFIILFVIAYFIFNYIRLKKS